MQRTIVCVEDDSILQKMYVALLGERGYLVRGCTTGAEALALLNEEIAHFIIIDMRLPDTDGLTLAEKIRQLPQTAQVPFMFVSSDETEASIVAGLELGAVDYIVKPFRPTELLAKVGSIFSRHALGELNGFGNGTQLFAGRYELRSKLGAGCSSTVMLARDITQPESAPVALKIYNLGFLRSYQAEDMMARFLREAYQMSKLHHANIVELKDFGKAPSGRFYLAMEHVNGETLQDLLVAYGVLPESQVASIGYHIAGVLEYFADRHLVHRDVSPRNIMITEGGQIKLIDFGLAKSYQDHLLAEDDMVLGTPIFVAPEILAGEAAPDVRSDIYSLGLTLYVLLCPDIPYYGTPLEIIEQRRTSRPEPLREAMPHISAPLARIIDAMCAEEPRDRPSIDEIREQLGVLILVPGEAASAAAGAEIRP